MVWQPLARPPNRFYMGKEKKIGFYYYLNKDLKPQLLEGVEHYPVYVRIAYSKNNTKFFFPVLYKASYITNQEFDKFFSDRNNPIINKQIESFEREITYIVRFESKVLGDKFSFKSLSKKRVNYQENLSRQFEKYVCARFIDEAYNETKNDNISEIYSDYLSFWDTFHLVTKISPNVLTIISSDLKLAIKAFIGLRVSDFKGIIDENLGLRIIDWLDEEVPIRYKDSILGLDAIETHFKRESKNSPVWDVLNQITIEKQEISKYLRIIEKTIVEITG